VIRLFLFALVMAAAVASGMSHAQPTKKSPPADPRPTELTGLVIRVIDGDTFWLRVIDGQPHEVVRLQNIDAPESCQPGGKDSTQALSRLVLNKTVNVKIAARDDYSRLIAKVFEGATDVGEQLVRDGHAWSQRDQYGRGPLMAYQRMAQTLKRGVHATGDAVEPREFRRVNGACEGAKPALPALTSATPAPAAAPVPDAAARTAVDAKGASTRRCDGRTYCSQMTSCEEATWFLKNCPGMKMDGNNDGRPCEQQLCR
jgi:endonuclease YncB( thermonuclease family)